MGLGDSAGMLFKIKADNSDAVRGLKETREGIHGVDQSAGGLSGTLSTLESAFGGSISGASGLTSTMGPVGAAIGVVTTLVTGQIAAFQKLFSLSNEAAEYGSKIYDAQQKTGLTADTLQALEHAADQSGSSFENITGSVSKFNVLLGEANDGNEKARATLEKYGITATDTNGALEQAVKTIAEMTTVDQQAAAAKALFKDRTGEILPVIKSFRGDLPGLINELREMGLLIGDENTAAADKFGDQMDTLKAQLAAIGRTIGFQVMPVFLKMAQDISGWLAQNQATIRTWAGTIRAVLDGLIIQWRLYARVVEIGLLAAQGKFVEAGLKAAEPLSLSTSAPERNFASGSGAAAPRSPGNIDDDKPSRAGRKSNADDEAAKAKREQERLFNERLQAIQESNRREIAEMAAKNDVLLATYKNYLREQGLADEQALEYQQNLTNTFLNFKRAKLQEELDFVKGNAKEEARVQSEIVVSNAEIEEEIQKQKAETADAIEKQLQRQNDLWLAQKEHIEEAARGAAKLTDEIRKAAEELDKMQEAGDPGSLGGTGKEGAKTPGIFAGWTASWKEFAKTIGEEAGGIGDVLTSLAGMVEGAFVNVAQALGQVIQQWVLYGETGPSVMRKILASALATIAAEAAVRAIYAAAYGFLMLAVGDFYSATQAFIAAGVFAAIAGTAAIAGRAVAGDAFKKQSGAATGKGSRSSGSSIDQNPSPYSRENPNTFDSGIRSFWDQSQNQYFGALTDAINQNTAATQQLHNKIETARPGDVLIRGTNEKPGHIADTLHRDIQRDAGKGKKIGSAMGFS